MLEKTKAIVLHTTRYGESSLIVRCFTEKWGRQSFLMKGVRKSKKNNHSNLFQPLFLLDLDVYYKSNRDLQWIKEVSMILPMNSLQQDMTKRTQALFLTEILSKTLQEEEQNIELFQFLEASIEYFEALEKALASFHLLFLFQFTKYLGFEPQSNYSEKRKYFDLNLGIFTEDATSLDLVRVAELGRYWKSCFTNSYEEIDRILINQDGRNVFLDSLLDFYRFHIENLMEIKSVEILRTIFNS